LNEALFRLKTRDKLIPYDSIPGLKNTDYKAYNPAY